MAVQIPKVAAVQDDTVQIPSQKITAQPHDVTTISSQVGNTAVNALGDMADHYQKQEQIAANSIAESAGVKYQAKFDDLFEGKDGLKYKKGEQAFTTDLVATNDNLKKYKEELLNNNLDMSDSAKEAINRKFNEMDGKFSATLNTWAGKTLADHQDATTEATADIYKRDAIHDLGFYNSKDPSSLSYFKNTLAKIGLNREAQADRLGTLHVDENGNKNYDVSTLYKIAKDKSDAVYDAISNLAATPGRAKDAQALAEEFSNYLDEKNRPALKEKIKAAGLRQDASQFAYQLIGSAKSPEQINQDIATLGEKDPELAEAAFKVYEGHVSRMNRISNIKSTQTYNDLAKYVAQKQASGQPFENKEEMKADPYVAGLIGNVNDYKKLTALEQQVETPKVSDPQKKSDMYDLMLNRPDEFKQLNLPLSEEMNGLDKTDRAMFEKAWRDMNSESKSERRMIYTEMEKSLQREMITAKVIKRDMFGKIRGDNEIKYNQARDDMMKAVADMPSGTSRVERDKWVQDYVVQKIRDGKDTPALPEIRTFNGDAIPRTDKVQGPAGGVPTTGAPPKSSMTEKQMQAAALKDYRREKKKDVDLNDKQSVNDFYSYYTQWKLKNQKTK